jgi:hypothetical protein
LTSTQPAAFTSGLDLISSGALWGGENVQHVERNSDAPIVLFGFRLAQKAAGAQLVVAHEGTEGRFDLIGGSSIALDDRSRKIRAGHDGAVDAPALVATGSCASRRGATRPPMQQLP